ncbi:hypothetical protein EZV62_014850 [Acer yangbiense]|uniref:Plastid lipid-associated protein/fibrillin conserved domain-containing protein n=1 Tax=Acer yangbiense TaxID=1000413 RepID=A0A5C7HT53_9ROSI|nr:hypothetical protein EZV62_014850 [Acer yangbiense]
MDTNVVKTAIQASQVFPSIPRITKSIKTQRFLVPLASSSYPKTKSISIGESPSGFRHIYITKAAAEQGHGLDQIKTDFYQAVKGIDRGIFGVPSVKKSEIDDLVKLLESQNPTPYPTSDLKKVDGCWKLVYTTITMKTKLGLKYFLSLGDIFQTIDVAKELRRLVRHMVKDGVLIAVEVSALGPIRRRLKWFIEERLSESVVGGVRLIGLWSRWLSFNRGRWSDNGSDGDNLTSLSETEAIRGVGHKFEFQKNKIYVNDGPEGLQKNNGLGALQKDDGHNKIHKLQQLESLNLQQLEG